MGCYIGICVGSEKIIFGIYNEELKLKNKSFIENNVDMGAEYNFSYLVSEVKNLTIGEEIAGIGISCCCPIDNKNGRILYSTNLPGWEEFNIKKYFEGEFHCKIKLSNDADTAALYEKNKGAAKGCHNMFYLSIGYGIGGAVIINDKILCGANNMAGEICNMIINEDTRKYKDLNEGAFESQCSGQAIAAEAMDKLGVDVRTCYVFAEAKRGNSFCRFIIDQWIVNIAKAIVNVISIIDPEIVVLGGKVILSNSEYLERIKKEVNKRVLKNTKVKIEMATMAEDSDITGAVLLLSDEMN